MLSLPQLKVALVSFGLALFSPTRGSSQSPMGGGWGAQATGAGSRFLQQTGQRTKARVWDIQGTLEWGIPPCCPHTSP